MICYSDEKAATYLSYTINVTWQVQNTIANPYIYIYIHTHTVLTAPTSHFSSFRVKPPSRQLSISTAACTLYLMFMLCFCIVRIYTYFSVFTFGLFSLSSMFGMMPPFLFFCRRRCIGPFIICSSAFREFEGSLNYFFLLNYRWVWR